MKISSCSNSMLDFQSFFPFDFFCLFSFLYFVHLLSLCSFLFWVEWFSPFIPVFVLLSVSLVQYLRFFLSLIVGGRSLFSFLVYCCCVPVFGKNIVLKLLLQHLFLSFLLSQFREERFRSVSESTNQRVLWWSIIQTIILVTTGFWQMRHLKSFFEAKKLV